MAANTTELEVIIKEQMQQALTSIDQLGSKLDGIGNKLDKTNKKAQDFGKAFSNVANFAGIVAFVKKLGTAVVSTQQKAQNFTEQLNLFNVVFKNTEKNGVQMYSKIGLEATRFQNKLQENFGAFKTNTMKYQALFQSMGQSSGIDQEVAETMSKAMTKMSYDLASLFNREEGDVAEALKAGVYAGQTKPMRQYGIDITQTSMQPIADSLGLKKSISEMSQAEKQMLRYIAVLKQGRVAMGDFANTIESPANQFKVLRQQVQELGVAIGSLFMGMFSKILPYINAVLMVLKEVIKTIAGIFGIKLRDYNTGLATTDDYYENIGKSAGKAKDKTKELKKEIMSFDQIHNIDTPTDNNSGGSGGSGVGSIDPKLLAAIKDYENGMENVRMKAVQIRDQIMEWLGFTKQVDAKTGEITWKLKDGWSNLKTIGVILGGAGILGILNKIKGLGVVKALGTLITKIPIVSTLLKTGKAVLSTFGTGLVEVVKGTAKFKDVIAVISPEVKTLLGTLGKTTGVVGGVLTSLSGANGLYGVLKNTAKGIDDASTSTEKFGIELTKAGVGGAAAGAILGGPLGAIIGGLTGYLVAGVAAWRGYQEGIKELVESRLFGDLTMEVEDWNTVLQNVGPNVDASLEEFNKFKDQMNELYATFDSSSDQLDKYLYKYGELGMKIGEEEGPKVLDAINTMFDSANQIVDTNTNSMVDGLVSSWQRGTSLTTEEQQNVLNSVIEYGEKQKKELETAQNNITTTYDNAIKKRGYLTDEEYKYIQQQLEKIRKLTQEQMTRAKSDLLLEVESFHDGNLKLDKKSYSNYKTARDAYISSRYEDYKNAYNKEIGLAEEYYRQNKDKMHEGTDEYKTYLTMKEDAMTNYRNSEKTLNQEIAGYNSKVVSQLIDEYGKIKDKTDPVSRETKKQIEDIFKDLDIDTSMLTNQWKEGANTCVRTANDIMDKGIKTDYKIQLKPQIDPKYNKLNLGTTSVDLKIGGKANGGIFANGKWHNITQYANGGLPSQGQMFIAREAGPELVGKIGNKTAVMNNGQIVDSVAAGVARAVAGVMGNGNGGAIELVLHTDEGVIVDRINRITDTTGTCPLII